jgi:hypothetical protein
LEWLWFFCTVVLAGAVLGTFNVFEILWQADQTKITFLILALFTGITILCGRESYLLSKSITNNETISKETQNRYDTGWFSSEICLTLGLIGTVSGFILMLSGAFSDLNLADPSSVQKSLSNMSLGMSTALYTTLVGLICSLTLKIQLVNVENENQSYGE